MAVVDMRITITISISITTISISITTIATTIATIMSATIIKLYIHSRHPFAHFELHDH
jgi:hypothetical protein